MNIRLLAGGLAIIVAGVLGYGVYQLIPMGEPLARSEVIGVLNGPALASYSRVALQRFGERQLLTGQLLVTARDVDGLRGAPVLDTQVPALIERLHKQRGRLALAAAPASGHGDLAMMMLQAGQSATEARNLIYGGRGTGVFELLGSIGGDTGVSMIGTPEGKTIYLVTGTVRSTGEGTDGGGSTGGAGSKGGGESEGEGAKEADQPDAWNVLRSDDLGATWTYDPEVTLGAPRQHTVFLTQHRVIALAPQAGGPRLLHSGDGARHWSATSLKEQVWPDAQGFQREFADAAENQRGPRDSEQLAYGWSLYPLDETRAVGWSWRMRVKAGTGGAGQETQVIETRRFEVQFQEGVSPAFRITPAVPPVPAQNPDASLTRDQPVFETAANTVYQLDKASKTWLARAVAPDVRGARTWIGDAWFGRNAWVIKTYADHLLESDAYTKTYFYTRDQGKNWRPFQLSYEQERGLLGLDKTGDALLSLAERDGKTVIRRYPLE